MRNLQSTLAKDPFLQARLEPRSGFQWAGAPENRFERPELLKHGICTPLPHQQLQAATLNASYPSSRSATESDLLNAWKHTSHGTGKTGAQRGSAFSRGHTAIAWESGGVGGDALEFQADIGARVSARF